MPVINILTTKVSINYQKKKKKKTEHKEVNVGNSQFLNLCPFTDESR
jgi:hypothetical protein